MNISPILKDDEWDRFMSLVDQNGCWFWNGPRDESYRPVFKHGGGEHLVRDILYQERYGVSDLIPCRVQGCINPDHIMKCGSKKPKEPRSKLRGADVLEILASRESVSDLAKKYEVSMGTIYGIVNGVTWKHIPRSTYKTVFRKRQSKPQVVKPLQRDIKTHVNGVTFNPDTGKYTASYYKKDIGESDSLEKAATMRAEYVTKQNQY